MKTFWRRSLSVSVSSMHVPVIMINMVSSLFAYDFVFAHYKNVDTLLPEIFGCVDLSQAGCGCDCNLQRQVYFLSLYQWQMSTIILINLVTYNRLTSVILGHHGNGRLMRTSGCIDFVTYIWWTLSIVSCETWSLVFILMILSVAETCIVGFVSERFSV